MFNKQMIQLLTRANNKGTDKSFEAVTANNRVSNCVQFHKFNLKNAAEHKLEIRMDCIRNSSDVINGKGELLICVLVEIKLLETNDMNLHFESMHF